MIRVLIVASSVVMQAGLAALLAARETLTLVDTATQPAMEAIEAQQPDVVLLVLDRLEEELMALFSELDEDPVPPAVVVLVEDGPIDGLNEWLRLGVRGVLPRRATASEIIGAIEAAAAGLVVFHPDVMPEVMAVLSLGHRTLPSAMEPPLTRREIEVLQMLAEGLGNKTIARRLSISEHTVKFHVGSIFSKLNVSSRTEAVMVGARQGLILL